MLHFNRDALLTRREVKMAGYLQKNAREKKKKRTVPMSSCLDRTSLVNKGFIVQQKMFDIIRIENNLSISRAGKEIELCTFCSAA